MLNFLQLLGSVEPINSNIYGCDRREILEETAPHLMDSVCAYRAGCVAEVSRLLTPHARFRFAFCIKDIFHLEIVFLVPFQINYLCGCKS